MNAMRQLMRRKKPVRRAETAPGCNHNQHVKPGTKIMCDGFENGVVAAM
jgi:hypothetical protein